MVMEVSFLNLALPLRSLSWYVVATTTAFNGSGRWLAVQA